MSETKTSPLKLRMWLGSKSNERREAPIRQTFQAPAAAFEPVAGVKFDDTRHEKGPSKGKFRTGLAQDEFREPVPSQWCTVQAVINATDETLRPSLVRFKASVNPAVCGKDMWYGMPKSIEVTHTMSDLNKLKRSVHHHVYLTETALMARKKFVALMVDLMNEIELVEDDAGHYRWELPKALEDFRVDFIQKVKTGGLPHELRLWFGIDDLADLLVDAIAPFMVNSNYNSYGSKLGCSILNMAQMLVHLERGTEIDPGAGKLQGPWAVPLQGGNEEEFDNIFFEYCTDVDDALQSQVIFERKKVGTFIANVFEGKQPRPTKSCRPDWVLKYRGCPVAYGEAKSHKNYSGLSYSTLCTTNILNFMPESQPAMLIYTTSDRIVLEAVNIDEKTKSITVRQRNCPAYNHGEPSDADLSRNKHPMPPILYKYTPLRTDPIVLQSMGDTFNLFDKFYMAHCEQAQQQRHDAEAGRKTNPKGYSSPAESYEYGHFYQMPPKPGSAPQYMLIDADTVDSAVKTAWGHLHSRKQRFLLSLFEAVDVSVAILYKQDYKAAACYFAESLKEQKFQQPRHVSIIRDHWPHGRNLELRGFDYFYSTMFRWQNLYDVFTQPFKAAAAKTMQDMRRQEAAKKEEQAAAPSTPSSQGAMVGKQVHFIPPMMNWNSPMKVNRELVEQARRLQELDLGSSAASPVNDQTKLLQQVILKQEIQVMKGQQPLPPPPSDTGSHVSEGDRFYHYLKSKMMHAEEFTQQIEDVETNSVSGSIESDFDQLAEELELEYEEEQEDTELEGEKGRSQGRGPGAKPDRFSTVTKPKSPAVQGGRGRGMLDLHSPFKIHSKVGKQRGDQGEPKYQGSQGGAAGFSTFTQPPEVGGDEEERKYQGRQGEQPPFSTFTKPPK